MILLDTTTRKLQIVLAGAKTTNDSPWVASYVDISQSTFGMTGANSATGASNGVTAVDVVAAPAASTTRQLKYFSLLNADTVAITVTVRYNDNATIRNLVTFLIPVGCALAYSADAGWYTMDASGNLKQSLSGTTANLTDYSTGTWTPTDNSGASLVFTGVSANYTKIGNMVFADFQLTFPATANGANNSIAGLPFANTTSNSSRQGQITFPGGSSGAKYVVLGLGPVTTFNFFDGTAAQMINSALSGLTLIGSLQYRTAA